MVPASNSPATGSVSSVSLCDNITVVSTFATQFFSPSIDATGERSWKCFRANWFCWSLAFCSSRAFKLLSQPNRSFYCARSSSFSFPNMSQRDFKSRCFTLWSTLCSSSLWLNRWSSCRIFDPLSVWPIKPFITGFISAWGWRLSRCFSSSFPYSRIKSFVTRSTDFFAKHLKTEFLYVLSSIDLSNLFLVK